MSVDTDLIKAELKQVSIAFVQYFVNVLSAIELRVLSIFWPMILVRIVIGKECCVSCELATKLVSLGLIMYSVI